MLLKKVIQSSIQCFSIFSGCRRNQNLFFTTSSPTQQTNAGTGRVPRGLLPGIQFEDTSRYSKCFTSSNNVWTERWLQPYDVERTLLWFWKPRKLTMVACREWTIMIFINKHAPSVPMVHWPVGVRDQLDVEGWKWTWDLFQRSITRSNQWWPQVGSSHNFGFLRSFGNWCEVSGKSGSQRVPASQNIKGLPHQKIVIYYTAFCWEDQQ